MVRLPTTHRLRVPFNFGGRPGGIQRVGADAPSVMVCLEIDVAGIFVEHRLVEVGQAVDRGDGREDSGQWPLAQIAADVDRRRQVGRVQDVVDLRGELAVGDGVEHRSEDAITKLINPDLLEVGEAAHFDQVGGGNTPKHSIFVRDRAGDPTVGIDDNDHAFGHARGLNGAARERPTSQPRHRERDQRYAKPVHTDPLPGEYSANNLTGTSRAPRVIFSGVRAVAWKSRFLVAARLPRFPCSPNKRTRCNRRGNSRRGLRGLR